MGLHPFRDPDVREDFEAVRLPLDIAELHTYAVDWTPDTVDFYVDDTWIRGCPGPPSYPMQMMLAVFDFPEQSDGHDADAVPELVVDHLRAFAR